MSIKRSVLILTLMCLSPSARAKELFEDYLSLRAAGMGNAFTSVVSNDEALFYNPAALCRVSGLALTLFDIKGSASGVELAKDISTLSGAANSSEFASTLQKFYGKEASAGLGVKSSVLLPCVGVAGYGTMNLSVQLENPAFPNLYFRSVTDYGAAAGFALDLYPELMTFGLVMRGIKRTGTDVPIGLSTLGTLSSGAVQDQLANTGTGFALDSGLSITLPTPIKPTISAVYKNMGDTTFTKAGGLVAPPTAKGELVLGAGISFETLLLSIRPAIDYKHASEPEIQKGKKLHAGVEVAIPFIAVRGGFYQGYYTAGVGINLGLLRVDAATWGVELGEYPGQDESRRYGVQARMEFTFDANFSLKSITNWGSSRSLKQRR